MGDKSGIQWCDATWNPIVDLADWPAHLRHREFPTKRGFPK